MNRWAPIIGFLAAAAILGVPVGWGIAAGWFCDCGKPPSHQ
jgi:hypothetical protein